LPLLFHFGRLEHAVAFYGCKITPADAQAALLRIPDLAPWIGEMALHPFEDERADKRLEIWVELRQGAPALDADALTAAFAARLAEENQDFRESLRMIEAHLRPSLRVFPAGQSPLAGQDTHSCRRSSPWPPQSGGPVREEEIGKRVVVALFLVAVRARASAST